jgi:hypothetical protein
MLNYFTEIIKSIEELTEENKLTFSLTIEIIGNFISFVCEFFLAPVYNNLNLDIIVQLVKYLTKINYIYNVIENDISFIKKEYKELKNEKKNEIKILEDKNLSLENQKNYYLEYNENKENNKNYENVNINDNNEIKITNNNESNDNNNEFNDDNNYNEEEENELNYFRQIFNHEEEEEQDDYLNNYPY